MMMFQKKKKPQEDEGSEENSEENSASGSEEESSSEEEEAPKSTAKKAPEVANPNRAPSAVPPGEQPQLSRREREELEKQQAREHYLKLHREGKTAEAKADLERLAQIRAQRELAAKRREEEAKAREAQKTAAKSQFIKK